MKNIIEIDGVKRMYAENNMASSKKTFIQLR